MTRDEYTISFIKDLCATEEALAALDQLAGNDGVLQKLGNEMYGRMVKVRDEAVEYWNSSVGEQGFPVYRCSRADDEYHTSADHTSADSSCDVWISGHVAVEEDGPKGRIFCETCAEKAWERQEAMKYERAEQTLADRQEQARRLK